MSVKVEADGGQGNGNGGSAAGRGRRRWLLPLVVLAVVALGAVGYYYWFQETHYVSENDATVTGIIVYIYPDATGILQTWGVSLGSHVRAGEVIGTIREPLASSAGPAGVDQPALVGDPVTAAENGVIVQNSAQVGEQVDPAFGVPLAAEVDPVKLWVQANVSETQIGRVHVGQRVDVHIDAVPGRTFEGRVEAIQDATQSTFSLLPSSDTSGTFTKVTQRIPVKVVLNSTAGLAPGMSAEVRIHVA